jgi:MarR family transcriptional regulator for hemolysin
LVLVSIKAQRHAMQRDLADALGIEGATLTHHLTRMEEAGLVSRRRDPANRRVQLVELTDEGDATFFRLAAVVADFDRRIRNGFSAAEVEALRTTLDRLRANAEPG